MQDYLILFAHGSRLAAANEEIRHLASRLEMKLNIPVRAAFLEMAKPDLPDAMDQALQKAANRIFVLPYFLTQGRHVEADIPKLVTAQAQAHPEVSIQLLPYLGKQESLVDILAKVFLSSITSK